MDVNIQSNSSGTQAARPLLTTSRMATDLLTFAHYLCHESTSSSVLVERVLNLFFYKNKSRFNAEIKLGNFNPNQYVFKRNDFYFLLNKIMFFFKRDFLFRLKTQPQNAFERLNWRERVVLVLAYKYKLSANDISHLLDFSKTQYIETLYAAKVALGMDFEETQLDRSEILFNDSDNSFFYQKNLEIYSSLNTNNTDQHSLALNKAIPSYGISIEDHKKVSQQILKSLRDLQSSNR